MATKTLKSVKFPGLPDTYIIPQGGGGGGPVTVDSALSDSSENPVQNKVVKAALDAKGTYSKPSGGIPDTDLSAGVQASLDAADAALPKAGGTMSGAIAMGSNKITGLADGTADGDAVNLGQVSSMISTNTAYFRGTFATKAALQAVSWQTGNPAGANYVTNNDYAVVLDDESQNDECWRYVYVSGTGWQAQYRINETPLTAAQLAALNSGATAQNIAAIADKIDKPSNPASGAFLVWNGSAWVAQTLAVWQASSY